MNDTWLVRFHPVDRAIGRLLCLPAAGSGPAGYWNLSGALAAAGVEVLAVHLPGRGDRRREPPYTELGPLLDQLDEVVAPLLDAPLALLGHSLGALISYELLHRLGTRQVPLAQVPLVVAACAAPQLPPRNQIDPRGLDDAALLERLRGYGGTPELVFRYPELVALLLPTIRADFHLADSYTHTPRPLLDGSIVALGGRADPLVGPAELDAWREQTTGGFSLRMFDGDHFFLFSESTAVAGILADHLTTAWCPGGRAGRTHCPPDQP